MRTIWKGSISFGLANIPIRLFSASRESGLDLDMLCKEDLSPIRYARICKSTGKEIPYQEIVKGFKAKGGGYVVLNEEDFKKADAKKTSTISVMEFTKKEEIEPMYFEKPYYLVPDKGAEKAYSLLLEAMNRTGKVGIGKFVLRNKEHIAAVMSVGNIIILNQLRFQEEIRDSGELDVPMAEFEEEQLEIATALIDQMTRPFEPQDFKDTYTEKLLLLIEKKSQGKEYVSPTAPPQTATDMHEIMKRLRESLEKEKQKAK